MYLWMFARAATGLPAAEEMAGMAKTGHVVQNVNGEYEDDEDLDNDGNGRGQAWYPRDTPKQQSYNDQQDDEGD